MNNTLNNGLMLLRHLAADAEECSVRELAQHFGLPDSHVCRLLKTLVETGYVEQIPGRRTYRISLKILTLSNARLRNLKIRDIARPYLLALLREFNRPVYLSANSGGRSIIIASEFPEHCREDPALVVGSVHTPNRAACGRVCAAFAPEGADVARDCQWGGGARKAAAEKKAFLKELARIRENGFALIKEEFEAGKGAVAAPVFNAAGECVGAAGVSLDGDGAFWDAAHVAQYCGRTRACGESISFALGFPLDGGPRNTNKRNT